MREQEGRWGDDATDGGSGRKGGEWGRGRLTVANGRGHDVAAAAAASFALFPPIRE